MPKMNDYFRDRTDNVSELEQERIDAVSYINSAPNPEERTRRKSEVYYVLYQPQQTLADLFQTQKGNKG